MRNQVIKLHSHYLIKKKKNGNGMSQASFFSLASDEAGTSLISNWLVEPEACFRYWALFLITRFFFVILEDQRK